MRLYHQRALRERIEATYPGAYCIVVQGMRGPYIQAHVPIQNQTHVINLHDDRDIALIQRAVDSANRMKDYEEKETPGNVFLY